jgi:hypothetical protein
MLMRRVLPWLAVLVLATVSVTVWADQRMDRDDAALRHQPGQLDRLAQSEQPRQVAANDTDKNKKDQNKEPADHTSGKRPSGREIQQAAEKAAFVHKEAIEHKYSKDEVVRFTPAELHGKTVAEMAGGVVMGRLHLTNPGHTTGLPAGTYNVYVKKVGDKWMAFYEKDGQIAKDAVNVEYHDDHVETPAFKEHTDCVRYSHWRFCF